eukprot:NODE_6786_length_536_cov_88.716632_g6361_i0.p1 GENE.NODE_6786_length_536_cov_88.716632_g6361_i0~~NODE_6786_length_536_cov_88.716632_g6361_i0.p1  ORF type:complete len:159 (+),score=35.65 NODE_6786_length_536_cov_88.716632_g6361_i0:60-479(+)
MSLIPSSYPFQAGSPGYAYGQAAPAFYGASLSSGTSFPAQALPTPPGPDAKLSITPERVERLLEIAFGKLDALGNQLRTSAQELEEVRAEILTANNLCDSELRGQLQQANDEIYRLRNYLGECAERKVNKMDRKDLLSL